MFNVHNVFRALNNQTSCDPSEIFKNLISQLIAPGLACTFFLRKRVGMALLQQLSK